MPTPEFFPMKPSEKIPVTLDYSIANTLPSGVTVSSGTVAAWDLSDNSSADSILSSATATTTTTSTKIYVTAPSTSGGKRYKVRFTTTCSDTTKLIEDVEVRVQDA